MRRRFTYFLRVCKNLRRVAKEYYNILDTSMQCSRSQQHMQQIPIGPIKILKNHCRLQQKTQHIQQKCLTNPTL